MNVVGVQKHCQHLCLRRNLCDQQVVGKLKLEQFVLAMHLISQKVKGVVVDLPTQLTPEMLSQTSQDFGFGVKECGIE